MMHKSWTEEEDAYLEENYEFETNEELAEQLDRTAGGVMSRLRRLELKREVLYALYDGDENVFTGTKEECAEYWNIKTETVQWYATVSYAERVSKSVDPDNRRMVVRV